MLIFQKMLTLLLLMGIGLFMRLRGWISDENAGLLSKIVVNIANPALIIAAGLDSATSISNRTLLLTFLSALLFYAVMIPAARLVVKIMRIPVSMRGTYQCMFIFGNIGFMGVPLITAVYGSEYALLEAFYNFFFLLLLYSYGVMLFRREELAMAAEAAGGGQENGSGSGVPGDQKGQWKKMINAGTVACVIALVCFLSKIQVPDFIDSTFDMLSSLCAPLSMFSIGASLGTMRAKELVSDMRLNLFVLLRLFLVPVIGILFYRLFTTDALLLRTFYVIISVPFASTCALMAQEHHGQANLAARGVALSTVLSVISLPVVGMIFGM